VAVLIGSLSPVTCEDSRPVTASAWRDVCGDERADPRPLAADVYRRRPVRIVRSGCWWAPSDVVPKLLDARLVEDVDRRARRLLDVSPSASSSLPVAAPPYALRCAYCARVGRGTSCPRWSRCGSRPCARVHPGGRLWVEAREGADRSLGSPPSFRASAASTAPARYARLSGRTRRARAAARADRRDRARWARGPGAAAARLCRRTAGLRAHRARRREPLLRC
jgi:hypothetical protein